MADGRLPRILLVSHTAGRLGAERSLLTLAERLHADRLAEIMVLLPEPGPLLDDLAARKIETRIARYYPWVGFTWTRFALAKRLARLPLTVLGATGAWPGLRRWGPDLIYINTVFSPMGLILAGLLGKPYIWHLREWISVELNTRFDLGRAAVMALLNRSRAETIFNSQAIADIYGRHLPDLRPAIVYNGFDFAGLPAPDGGRRFDETVAGASPLRLAVIGSVQPAKGQEDAIRALPPLLAAGVPAHLEIIGQGRPEYVASLKSLAAEQCVADQVSFRGYVADAASQLDGIAAVLVPSRYEPFGRVAAEAQAHGVPVVAAAVGGLPEIVQDNKTGLLFPPGDVEQLAAKTVTLLRERDLYDSLVAAAWRHATEAFTHDRYAAGVWAVMLRAMDESAAGGADGR